LPVDVRASHLFDGDDAGKSPQIGVGDPGMLLLDGLEEDAGVLQAGVGRVTAFGLVTHAGAVAAAGIGLGVVGAGGVPVDEWVSTLEVALEGRRNKKYQARRTRTGPAEPSSYSGW